MKIQLTKGLRKQRLVGIDLFRGIAAYAVCVIHSDAVMTFSGFSIDNQMAVLTQLSRFAVPFFLAASFYLMTNNLYSNDNRFSLVSNFKSRCIRLFIPYVCWTTIYMSLRVLQALITDKQLVKLFQDPVRIIFLGGAAFHLYFLPLLFSGSFLIIFAQYLAKRHITHYSLITLFALTAVVYEIMIVSGNGFQLGRYCLEENATSCSIAFQGFIKTLLPNYYTNQLLRLVLVEISWLVQCLPYVFMGMLLNHPAINKSLIQINRRNFLIFIVLAILLSAFRVLNEFRIFYFPSSLYELGTSCCLLISSILFSKYMDKNRLLEDLGVCSFGIYLVHYLTLIPYAFFASELSTKVKNVSPTFTMLSLATLSFLTSWAITYFLVKKKLFSRILFGV